MGGLVVGHHGWHSGARSWCGGRLGVIGGLVVGHLGWHSGARCWGWSV